MSYVYYAITVYSLHSASLSAVLWSKPASFEIYPAVCCFLCLNGFTGVLKVCNIELSCVQYRDVFIYAAQVEMW